MVIYKNYSDDESKKFFYPIITCKSLYKYKNRKFDYYIHATSDDNKKSVVFERMIQDGFNVEHVGIKKISGGYTIHIFGLILSDGFRMDFITPINEYWNKIRTMSNEINKK